MLPEAVGNGAELQVLGQGWQCVYTCALLAPWRDPKAIYSGCYGAPLRSLFRIGVPAHSAVGSVGCWRLTGRKRPQPKSEASFSCVHHSWGFHAMTGPRGGAGPQPPAWIQDNPGGCPSSRVSLGWVEASVMTVSQFNFPSCPLPSSDSPLRHDSWTIQRTS